MPSLTPRELVDLVRSVFPRHPNDRALAFLVDIPRDSARDNPPWKERRALAFEWWSALRDGRAGIPLDAVRLYAYPDVGSNNADLPTEAYLLETAPPDEAAGLDRFGLRVTFEHIFTESQILLAPTEYSTTAPLKMAAKKFLFRAATMPGFDPSMIPALRIDYGEVAHRVEALKARLDEASGAEVVFLADGRLEYRVHFDLRHRTAHSSTGRFPEQGTAGNLPSGEAYIVPYEGEKGEASLTSGTLPVEIDGQIVLFKIDKNTAVQVEGDGSAAEAEGDHLKREPAYGNMAELGFGVLADFGLTPCGEILLDEKLGLHVAFGRSEHFGGIVGPKNFSSPAAVIHLDRIYIPESQPRVAAASVTFVYPDGRTELVMKDGRYSIFD
jgi:hypothetical protein